MYDLFQGATDESQGCIKGVAIGIVTDNKDPQGMGRVKVHFPWVESEGDSHWARISTLMAGKDRGTVFLPEPEDEVLVAFDKGDIRHPYILGALWNGQDNPPETNADGKNNIRKIKSRSGHEIIFNDDHTALQEKIEIHTNKGHKIVLDDSTGSEKIEIKDHSGSNKIIIDSVQKSISIESDLQLKIKSTKIDIEASAAMTIKAGGTLTIQGALVKIN
jgi:uncharacterized protein involved in type VI secretion and phage assembly